ncbi:MAG TPA: glycosyltransferase family 39 protein, partial [Gaiellaceae bacterium]|nr:glycosyltransferase family 39 protein [Gaiellaceae bacterium]
AYRSGLTVRRLYRHPYLVLAVVAGLPRLVALLSERDDILAAFTDKSDDFAQTFLADGTYGFIPGVPSAYTQPLYGFFLIPIYWIDRSWVTVGAAHIGVAIVTAWLVFAIGRRVASDGVALGGAVLATLHPYIVWHDVHLNREILDQVLAAAVVLLALVAAERRSLWWAAALGAVLGLAILGNARLVLLPLVLGLWLMVRLGFAQHGLAALLLVCAGAALVLAPWVTRNRVSVGCFAITTDSRALWKANNLNTYDVLARGGWIDDVPPLPGAPPSPQDAGAIYRETGRIVEVDECTQMRLFQDEVVDFWRDHPGEKLRLAGQSARILWQPNVLETQGRPGAGTWRDTARSVVEPTFMIALYAFALVGLFVLPRSFVVLALILLGYQTVVAMLFAGATRYRVPWDFLVAIMAAAGIAFVVAKLAERRRGYEPARA